MSTVWLDAVPGGGGHWKVYRRADAPDGGDAWLGWVHRLDAHGRRWQAKAPDGVVLVMGLPRRRDAIAALLERAVADRGEVFRGGELLLEATPRQAGQR